MKPLMAVTVIAFSCMSLLAIGLPWTPYKVNLDQEPSLPYAQLKIDHLYPSKTTNGFAGSYFVFYKTSPSQGRGTSFALFSEGNKYYALVWTEKCWDEMSTDERRQPLREPLNQVKVEISEQLGMLVYEIWVNAIMESRYSRADSQGLDGITYTFGVRLKSRGWFHAWTWSPEDDLPPKWMTEVGDFLAISFRERKFNGDRSMTELKKYQSRLYGYLITNGISQKP